MTSKTSDLTGHKFNRWTVIGYAGLDKFKNRTWQCKCECGTERSVTTGNLTSGASQSCGCLNKEAVKAHNASLERRASMITHGMSRTPTGDSWTMMMQRCFNPKRNDYPRYGGKGIRPCECIKASPCNLLALIGERPSRDLTLDRIKNKFGYTCGTCEECISHGWPMNVRWATSKVQNRNRGNNRYITINGVSKLADEWAKEFGVTVSAIRQRYIYRAKQSS